MKQKESFKLKEIKYNLCVLRSITKTLYVYPISLFLSFYSHTHTCRVYVCIFIYKFIHFLYRCATAATYSFLRALACSLFLVKRPA